MVEPTDRGVSWDRALEQGLPDCRLRGPARRATTVVRAGQIFERVFCANCGAPGGAVTANWSPHVSYLCDRPECLKAAPKQALQIPEEVVRGAALPSEPL